MTTYFNSTTVVIVARNAQSTILRAIQSVRIQSNCPILVIDDDSTDSTKKTVVLLNDPMIRIISIDHHTLGHARRVSLENITTKFGMILDADDEFLPERIPRITKELNQNHDLVFDEIELYDGVSNTKLRDLRIPDFLNKPPGLLRLFERNYLPGIGQISFRTEFLKQIQYDASLESAEDYDIVLRALSRNPKIGLIHESGYRMHAYENSTSRNIDRQKKMCAKILAKFDAGELDHLFAKAELNPLVRLTILTQYSIVRGAYSEAMKYVESMGKIDYDPNEVIEPLGPIPYPVGWTTSFLMGTIAALQGDYSNAIKNLKNAVNFCPTAETQNNLGVAYFHSAKPSLAKECFEKACLLQQDYHDANYNLLDSPNKKITQLPLRTSPSRSEYHHTCR